MQLRLTWVDAFDAEVTRSVPAWRVIAPGQRVLLRAELAQLAPGELQWSLRAKRRVLGRFQPITAEPKVSGDAHDQRTLDFTLNASDLGVVASSFAVRKLELTVDRVDPTGASVERARDRAYAMPQLQFRTTHYVRFFAFAPLLLLLWAWSAGEMSDDVAAWYGALSLFVGIVVQEQPLARFSSALRAATRGVVPALLLMAALLFAQWLLLVRVENQTHARLELPGLQLEHGRGALTWRWRVPTPHALASERRGESQFEIEARGAAGKGSTWPAAFWETSVVCCKPFWLACQTSDRPAECERTSACQQPTAASSLLGTPVELDPGCGVPPQVVVPRPIAVVLGHGAVVQDDRRPRASIAPPCAGDYELALSERSAYSGEPEARAQQAASYPMLRLSSELAGLELRWKNLDAKGGFVSLLAKAPHAGEPDCRAMVPVRSGAFEVELRSPELLGTLRCPSLGSCEGAFEVTQAYGLQPSGFDGLEEYAVEHGRSIWTPLGAAAGGYVCRCSGEEERRPKQATLRLSRPAPPRLRLRFGSNHAPSSLDIAAADDRSTLQCELRASSREVEVQPVQLSFTRTARQVVVRGEDALQSDWSWLEGEHQPWSCVPAAGKGLEIVVDQGRPYRYVQAANGDTPQLPVCYLHPQRGTVAFARDGWNGEAPPRGCQWQEAMPEYAELVRSENVCSKVMSCR